MKDIKVINKSIASIAATGKKLDSLIQSTAVDVLEHFQEHRDTSLVNRLFLAMPKGGRSLALADWLLKFVAVKPNADKDTRAASPFIYAKDKIEAMMAEDNLSTASTTMWYDLKKEKSVDEAYDVMAAFKTMLRHIERSAKVEHFDRDALVAFGKAVGVAESDIPTKPGLKAKNAGVTVDTATADVLATAEVSPL